MLYLRKRFTYRNEESGEGEGGAAGADAKQDDKNTEIEDKARKMGWTPKEEFRGDPEKWRDAAEFVERGENMIPIMKATVKKQEQKISDLEKTIKEFADYHSKTEQRAYERAFRELKEKQIQAVAAGDAQTFVKVDAEIEDLRKQASEVPTIKPQNNAVDPVYEEWASRNKWIEDKTLEKEAEAQAIYLRERGNTKTGTEFLDAVKERVKREFPEKFENPRRNAAPAVEGSTTTQRKGGKTYSDMPPEVRAACDRFVAQKLLTKEAYVKQYFEGEE